ncbi:hypothetical protein [uncultured Sphingomonas sp.]|uniref:hypothetical protein n=1 Tax=uncultured Sphingomonas sp. TaxID=158754 RepID=UPI0025913ECF|nr:hypothetical protein [uncultured Sphingomonas sp.]
MALVAGAQVFDVDGRLSVDILARYGRFLGSIEINLPGGYLNRFQSGTVSIPGLAGGGEGIYYYLARDYGYCPFPPEVTFSGTQLNWQFNRTAETDAANGYMNYEPSNGTLYYGVM